MRYDPDSGSLVEGQRKQPSYTVDDFCEAERICRAQLYALWRQGKGPRFYLVGHRRRITPQARREWQAARECE